MSSHETAALPGEQNPFLRYRHELDSFARAQADGLSEDQYVEIVAKLDDEVATVWGSGFVVTPLLDGRAVASEANLDVDLSIKVEAGSVGGSHKARHLFGVALHQLIDEATGVAPADRFAIASCGNAALGAAVVARAMDRRLDVFVPVWADETVVAQLAELGASINRCERRDGEAGDPCYLRFREAADAGAAPFSVQGTDTPTTFDGGRTLGWEIAEQVGAQAVDSLYIQVGGGALATSVSMALPSARLHPVQAEGCAPLQAAWAKLGATDLADAADSPDHYMTPWPNPHSLATGILDDITYDWVPLLQRTRDTGGHPVVAPESVIERAYAMAHEVTDINVCATGTAGLAGLLTEPPPEREHVVVLFTGIDRT